jgi:5-methylcytosine-specific restriction endonuclease McrA
MKDKEKVKEYNKKYYSEHREQLLPKMIERTKIWAKKNKDYVNKYSRELRRKQIENEGKSRNSLASKLNRQRNKKEVIEKMGGKCTCCGETEIDFLTMDHVNNDGAQHRRDAKIGKRGGGDIWRYVRDNNYPPDFQILCFNCNYSKFLGGGTCAHKRIKEKDNTI